MAKLHLPKSIKRFKDWTRHFRRLHLMAPLWWRNRTSAESVLQEEGPVVSLTTYGMRTAGVYLAIESIGRGTLKPSSLVLWLDEADVFNNPPETLQRLVRRGLTMRLTPNYGPHKKYFPQVSLLDTPNPLPLVTADDDTLYPSHWLQGLQAAYQNAPDVVHCWRAKRIATTEGRVDSYDLWPDCTNSDASFANFAIGCSGVIYPPSLQLALKQAGDGFKHCCPKADDIWLHLHSLRNGFKVKQILPRSINYPCIPGTESVALFNFNVYENGNDLQFAQTYGSEDLRKVAEAAATDHKR